MKLSVYQNNISNFSTAYSTMEWSVQVQNQEEVVSNNSLVDSSVRGNRLYEDWNGSIEIVPKTPSEVFGERVLKPFTDTGYVVTSYVYKALSTGFSYLNQFANSINFIPGAEAAPTSSQLTQLEKCLAPQLDKAYATTEAAISTGDPNLMIAANELYGPFFDECFNEESFRKAQDEFTKQMAFHKEERKKHEDSLKDCQKRYGQDTCYTYRKIEKLPEVTKTTTMEMRDGKAVVYKEWDVKQGYLSWSVFANKWFRPDPMVGEGSYNYNTMTHEQTTKEEI